MKNASIDISNVTLKTERLLLRPFQEDDLSDFFEYASVDGVGEWAGWAHHTSIEESKKILSMFIKGKKTFAIVFKNKVIGSLGLEECHYPETVYPELTIREIGYVLSKDYWGKGFMSEAVKAVISYCFNVLSLDALTVSHFGNNDRSRRVIEKNGFQYLFSQDYKTAMGTIVKDNRCYILLNMNKFAKGKR